MSARILVGSCSWTDPTLISSGRFYPRASAAPRTGCATMRSSSPSSRSIPRTTRRRRLATASSGRRARRKASSSTSRPTHCSPAIRRAWTACPAGCGRHSRRDPRQENAYRKDLRPAPWRALGAAPRRPRAARRGRQARRRAVPVPALVHAQGGQRRVPARAARAAAGLAAGGGVPWRRLDGAGGRRRVAVPARGSGARLRQRRRAPGPPDEHAAGRGGHRGACDRPPARPQRRAPGIRAPAPPRTASSTSTATPNSRSGCRTCASSRARRRPSTSSSTTTTRTGACATPGAWRDLLDAGAPAGAQETLDLAPG